MPDFRSLVRPEHTAILCMEMQRGVVGDLARFDGPNQAVKEAGVVDRCVTLFTAARRAEIPIIHCTAAFRPDGAGSYRNMPFVEKLMDDPEHIPVGSPAAEVLPELRGANDLVSQRLHGISPFTDTDLNAYLRSFDTRTVIATGVSLNRGIIGISMEAVNRGYSVVIPTDAVAGFPAEYGALVLQHTLDGLTTLTLVDDLLASWGSG